MTLATLAQQAPTVAAPFIGTRELIVLLMVMAVMIVQLVNNLINSRSNKDIRKSVEDMEKSITGVVTSAMATLNVSIERLTKSLDSLTSMNDSIEKIEDSVEKVEEIVSLKDEEGRCRVHTPAKMDEIQRASLNLITQISKSQEGIATQLASNCETMHQVALLVTAMEPKTPRARKGK